MKIAKEILGSRISNMLLTTALTVFLIGGILPQLGSIEVFGASSPLKSGTYNHASRFDGNLIVNGVDVSYWQGTASNWNVAKQKGVEYAIMRVTWTSYAKGSHNYKNKDSHFTTHYKKAKNAGIMTGAYVFSQAKSVTEAKNEAKYAVSTLKEYGITPGDMQLPVYMDYEYSGGSAGRLNGLKAATAKKCAKAFCDIIRNAGYQPGIYANTNFFKSMLGNGTSLDSDIDLWCAQYYNKNQSASKYSKWQYSSSAAIGSGKKGLLFTTTDKVGSTDVNFWYIPRKPKAIGSKDIAGMKIYGATAFNYTGKLIKPDYQIYDGSTRLKEGKDYAIGYINNVQKGSMQAYAYIKGVGDYNGYALIPFTIGSGYIKHMDLISDGKDGYILANAGEKNTYKLSVSISEDENEDCPENVVVEETADMQGDESGEKEGDTPADAENTGAQNADAQNADAQNSGANTDTAVSVKTESDTSGYQSAADAEETGSVSQNAADTDTAELSAEKTADAEKADTSSDGSAEAAVSDDMASLSISSAEVQASESSSSDSLKLTIGNNKNGGYIRNIPSGTTAKKLLNGLAIRKGFQNKYTVAVINSKGVRQDSSAKVKTGMMIGIYDSKGSLAGTADLAVKGDNIKDKKGKDPIWGYADALSVKKTSIASIAGGSGSFTVTAKKLTQAASNGYQLRYSLKSDMSGSTGGTISSSYSKVTRQVTGLKQGKTYYVQVRNIKVVNGNKYYSSWSSAKSVSVQ